jgi:hypothetical protein
LTELGCADFYLILDLGLGRTRWSHPAAFFDGNTFFQQKLAALTPSICWKLRAAIRAVYGQGRPDLCAQRHGPRSPIRWPRFGISCIFARLYVSDTAAAAR